MYRSVVQPQKKWEQLQCVGWSPGHLVMFDESMSVMRANTFTLNHSDAFGIIWQCPRMDMRATIPWSAKALCAFLQKQSLIIFVSCSSFKVVQTCADSQGTSRSDCGIVCIGWQVLSSWKSRLQIVDIYFMIKNVTISILIWIWYGSPTSIWRLGLHDRRQWAPQRLSASETPMATPIGTTAPGPHGQKNDTAACDVVCKITQKTHFSGMRTGDGVWNDWSDEKHNEKIKGYKI